MEAGGEEEKEGGTSQPSLRPHLQGVNQLSAFLFGAPAPLADDETANMLHPPSTFSRCVQ